MHGILAWVCNSSTEETQTGGSLGHVGQSSKLIHQSPISCRPAMNQYIFDFVSFLKDRRSSTGLVVNVI